MVRAAVIIGINKTGGLPQLADAVGGARQVEAWALAQGMARELVIVHTDETGPVALRTVQDSIKRLTELGTIDQLFVYFAGHGVNIHRGEYWLLSDAPAYASEAINVEGSVALARGSGIPHVVLVSDACRTAAEGIQAQAVTGGDVFPSGGGGALEAPVDVFFASMLGQPALEVKDPTEAAGAYKALYTSALVDALGGVDVPAALVESVPGDTAQGVVRAWPLKRYLIDELPRRIRRRRLPIQVTQVPDARITSPPDAWLSRVALPAQGPRLRGGGTFRGPGTLGPPLTGTLEDVGGRLVTSMLRGGGAELGRDLERASSSNVPLADALARDAAHAATGFGTGHFESQSGFKIRGAGVQFGFARDADVQVLAADTVRVVLRGGRPATSVHLVLDNGTGRVTSVVTPAIREFVCGLTFDADGALTDVAYEPSDNTGRWQEYQRNHGDIRALRAVIATAANYGVFRLAGKDADKLARRMQVAKGLDPTLALYAAYAYHDLQERERIHRMSGYLRRDLGLRLLDVEMLAHHPLSWAAGPPVDVFPFVPLLAQGWALLDAYGVQLDPRLQALRPHVLPSLWTQFDAAGTTIVQDVIHHGGVL